ncbi:MAG: CPBP family intramembrane glutamic endopeptidase [Hyphomicrobium sp.]
MDSSEGGLVEIGSARDGAKTTWVAAAGVLGAIVAILGGSTVVAVGVASIFDAVSGSGAAGAHAPGALENVITARLGVFLLAMQAAALVLTHATARLFWGKAVRAGQLSLAIPAGGVAVAARSIAGLLVLASLYCLGVYLLDPNALIADVQVFGSMMRTDTWWVVALPAIIGAPLAEETLFRGLGYGVLRVSPLGLTGAALVTAFVWAAVHGQYSVYGLLAIFLIGLYLAYVREKTGSLLVPMLCHGVYNGAIVLLMLWFLQPDGSVPAAGL